MILTTENLREKGITYVNWCSTCKSKSEHEDHLQLHCEVVGMQWMMSRTVKYALQSWTHMRGKKGPRA